MNKRDFARVRSQAGSRGASRIPAVMAAVSLLFTAGIAFTAGYMTGEKQNAPDALKVKNAGLQQRLSDQAQQLSILQKKIDEQQLAEAKRQAHANQGADATKKLGDLTFYSELPRQKVMPAPLGDVATSSAPINKPAPHAGVAAAQASPGISSAPEIQAVEYRLQVGSYIRRSDAEGLFNRLAAAGLPARISEKNIEGMGVRYRVVMGPYNGLATAQGVKSQMRDMLGIDGLLLRD